MIFVDADAFVALAVPLDSNHNRAMKTAIRLREQREELITSSFAFGEAVTVISQQEGRTRALQFTDEIPLSGMVIVDVDAVLREKGVVVFRNQTSKNVSFTDCVNMAIMREEKVRDVFSFDKVYAKNGFYLL